MRTMVKRLALLLARVCAPGLSWWPFLPVVLLLEFHYEIPDQTRLYIQGKFCDSWHIGYM